MGFYFFREHLIHRKQVFSVNYIHLGAINIRTAARLQYSRSGQGHTLASVQTHTVSVSVADAHLTAVPFAMTDAKFIVDRLNAEPFNYELTMVSLRCGLQTLWQSCCRTLIGISGWNKIGCPVVSYMMVQVRIFSLYIFARTVAWIWFIKQVIASVRRVKTPAQYQMMFAGKMPCNSATLLNEFISVVILVLVEMAWSHKARLCAVLG